MVNLRKYTKMAIGCEIQVHISLEDIPMTSDVVDDFIKMGKGIGAEVITAKRGLVVFEIEDPGKIDRLKELIKEFGW